MRFKPTEPPRVFSVGRGEVVNLKDCGRIELEADEQVTFVTESGAEYDLVRKSWGFYATPSLNGRLRRFGLRAVLVKATDGKFYIFLVEGSQEDEFHRYLKVEGHQVVSWLDSDDALEALERKLNLREMKEIDAPLRCPCEGAYFSQRFSYLSPPEGEVRIRIDSLGAYRREVVRCSVCGHFASNHDMDIHDLYRSDYVTSIYEDAIGIRRAFDRINSLDPALSDNVGRVRRVIAFAKEHPAAAERDRRPPSVLDVGSGLCVFLYRMKSEGWDCTAVDPDSRSVQHARDTVGVKAVCGDFRSLQELGRFDALTFNKVLEHVEDPVGMLSKSAENLYDGGFVYVEVPDGESAAAEGAGRQEFFIEHLHVFSSASLTLLASRSGFTVRRLERLREPSGKFTLCAFLITEKRGQAGGGFPRRDGSVPSPP